MPTPSNEIEQKVARVLGALFVALALVVGLAVFSSARHPEPASGGDAAIAAAVNRADPDPSPSRAMAPSLSRPAPVREASGDPRLRTGFGHLQLEPAVTVGSLSVFPVARAADKAPAGRPAPPEFSLLADALQNGDVSACEPDAPEAQAHPTGGLKVPPRSATNAEEGDEHRAAHVLLVTNIGPHPTYVPDGQIVPGGDQDRGVAADTIVPARSARVSVAAFCVEQGRSSGPSSAFGSHVAIAMPAVRYAMQVAGNQQPVWDSVAQATSHFGATTDSGTYAALVRSPAANAAIQPYADSLTLPVAQAAHGRPVGVVVAINGRLVCADLYRDPALFAQMWPALLRSYALQAAMTPCACPNGGCTAGREAAARWLGAMDAAPGAQTRRADLTAVARVATAQGAGIRTAAMTGGAGLRLLHEAFWTADAARTR